MAGQVKKLDSQKLSVGSYVSRISYMRVVGVSGNNIEVENKDGFRWTIAKSILEAEATASDQFTEVRKVSRTELARVFEQDVRDTVFSVTFTKLPDPSDQDKILTEADVSTPAKRKRVAKELSTGKERVLHGHIQDTHEVSPLSSTQPPISHTRRLTDCVLAVGPDSGVRPRRQRRTAGGPKNHH